MVKGPLWDRWEDQEDEAIESDNEEFRDAFESGNPYSPKANIERIKKEGIKEGDYVYGPEISGVFFKGGVVVDLAEDDSLHEEDEWKSVRLRESTAKSSLIRCR